ncbi:MAG TPA: amidohydrolase family protein [Myxococcota bacterium]|nr:amidohydrolase family protein [Myxococcota bacterium]
MGLIGIVAGALACEAVVDVIVHAPDGPHPGWDVVWSGDRIQAVGPHAAPAGCTTHAVPGGQVTPGLIATGTRLGLIEVDQEGGTHDGAGEGDPVRAALNVADVYNPWTIVVPVVRLGGVTAATIHPTGGFVTGQAGAVRLHGTTVEQTVLARRIGVGVDFNALGGASAGLLRLRELLADARHYTSTGARWEGLDVLTASRLDLEALADVVAGRLPLLVGVDRAGEIDAVLRLAEAERVRVVLFGGAEAWMLADRLAAARVAVVVDPLVYGPGSFDQLHARPDNAAILARAGVDVILGAGGTHNARALRFVAGNAVRGGMTHEQALAAITATPARVFGLAGRGALTVGAVADLVVWTGDPLDIPGRLHTLVIGGDVIPQVSRQTELVDAWRELPSWPLRAP